jgi:hypothetical protein
MSKDAQSYFSNSQIYVAGGGSVVSILSELSNKLCPIAAVTQEDSDEYKQLSLMIGKITVLKYQVSVKGKLLYCDEAVMTSIVTGAVKKIWGNNYTCWYDVYSKIWWAKKE